MDTKYLDDLILHEYGKHDINKYNEWATDWHKWLKDEKLTDEKSTDNSKVKSIVVEQKKVDSNNLNK